MPTALYVFHAPVFGGPQNQLLRTHEDLARLGWSSIAVCPAGTGADRLRAAGVTVIEIELRRIRQTLDPRMHIRMLGSVRADVARLARIIKSHQVDLVQVHGLINFHGAFAATLQRVPLVWQILDTRSPRFVRLGLMPFVVALADAVMFTGRSMISSFPFSSLLSSRTSTYLPPVDVELFAPRLPERQAGPVVIGSLGNLNPQKGHEWFLRAVGKLVRDGESDFRAVIYGASTPTHLRYETTLRELIRDQGVEDFVEILDPGASPEKALNELDVFCVASVPLSEGIPTAMLEAMSAGLPVVSTDVGSIREVLDGRGGLVVEPLSVEAIADALRQLLHDQARRLEFGSRNREFAEQCCASQVVAAEHAEAYAAAVRRKIASPGAIRSRLRRMKKW
jgi:glycosyltransferase involved in cell wall biosynthesis